MEKHTDDKGGRPHDTTPPHGRTGKKSGASSLAEEIYASDDGLYGTSLDHQRGREVRAALEGAPPEPSPAERAGTLDEALAAEVREALLRDTTADAHDVEVQAEGHDIYLWGSVPDAQTKRAVEACASNVPGVKAVHSTILPLG